MVKRTQAEEAADEKTFKTLLADDACQNVGHTFLATRSRNAKVSHTSFSWHTKWRTDLQIVSLELQSVHRQVTSALLVFLVLLIKNHQGHRDAISKQIAPQP